MQWDVGTAGVSWVKNKLSWGQAVNGEHHYGITTPSPRPTMCYLSEAGVNLGN